MTQTSKSCKFLGQHTWPRRALPCRDQDSISRMPRKASFDPKICPRPRSFAALGTSRIVFVPFVGDPVFAAERANGSCMTLATWCSVGHATSTSSTRSRYQVLDHDPDHRDIAAFFQRFRMALRLRRLKLQGVTT